MVVWFSGTGSDLVFGTFFATLGCSATAGMDAGAGCGRPPRRGERVLLALTNRHIGSARACRTVTTSHLLGSGVGVAHARSALRAKRALAGGDLRWKIHQS